MRTATAIPPQPNSAPAVRTIAMAAGAMYRRCPLRAVGTVAGRALGSLGSLGPDSEAGSGGSTGRGSDGGGYAGGDSRGSSIESAVM